MLSLAPSPQTAFSPPSRLSPVARMSESPQPDWWARDSRCGLCQFRLEDGELVVAGKLQVLPGNPLWLLVLTLRPVLDGEKCPPSVTFTFRLRDGSFGKRVDGISVRMCTCDQHRCRHLQKAYVFHVQCHNFHPLPLSSKFLVATNYSFTPSPSIRFELQRWCRIRRVLAARLRADFLKQMPLELCSMVAGYLVRECAIVTAQELDLDSCAAEASIKLSPGVYAQYTSIEGNLYVQSLHNTLPTGANRWVQLLKPRRGVIPRVYIAYDHLGIRSIRFVSRKNREWRPPSHDTREVWWTELARKSGGIQWVTAITDASLL